MTLAFGAFEDIAVPAWMDELGFTDQSWHNDTCARAVLWIDEEKHLGVCVWVERERPEDREWSEFSRYSVEALLCESHWCDGEAPLLYLGDDDATACAAVVAAVEAIRTGQPVNAIPRGGVA